MSPGAVRLRVCATVAVTGQVAVVAACLGVVVAHLVRPDATATAATVVWGVSLGAYVVLVAFLYALTRGLVVGGAVAWWGVRWRAVAGLVVPVVSLVAGGHLVEEVWAVGARGRGCGVPAEGLWVWWVLEAGGGPAIVAARGWSGAGAVALGGVAVGAAVGVAVVRRMAADQERMVAWRSRREHASGAEMHLR